MHAESRLWQLISPALPVGAYSYSEGLEQAIGAGLVHDEPSAAAWIGGIAEGPLGMLDLPLMLRIHHAARRGDGRSLEYWSTRLATARETAELRRQDADMAAALRRLLATLAPRFTAPGGAGIHSYPAVFAAIAAHWDIDALATLRGYLWGWAENQVAAATRLVPLGQSAAQRILFNFGGGCAALATAAAQLADDDIGFTAPGQVLASMAHETRYTRLFRS